MKLAVLVLLAATGLWGCSSCGQGSSPSGEVPATEDAAPRFMAAGPDGGRRFRIRGPAVRAMVDGGAP